MRRAFLPADRNVINSGGLKMRKIVLFIAMSLDGYIADIDGKVDWLAGQDNDVESDDSYTDFVKTVDTVIMGWTTYRQIVEELSPGQWVYDSLQSYVITHRDCVQDSNVTFVSEDPCTLVNELKQKDGKDIWVCGGADIVHQLMQNNLIDIYSISIIPTILGNGIRLFDVIDQTIDLRFISSKSSNGIVELVYQKR